MTHQQRTALQRYAAARRAFRAKPGAATAAACIDTEGDALDAGCTLEQCAEIRRGIDLALALDAYRDAERYRGPYDTEHLRAQSAAVALGATPEQLAKARAESGSRHAEAPDFSGVKIDGCLVERNAWHRSGPCEGE